MTAAVVRWAPPVLELFRCAGECALPLPREAFGSDGYGGRRSMCKRCHVAAELARRAADREAGVRRCRACERRKPLSAFEARAFADGVRVSTVCRDCTPEPVEADPLEESAADLAEGLRRKVRWAVALQRCMDAAGIDLAGYKALRGDQRRLFEMMWSEVMRNLAIEAGEWPAEHDRARDPAEVRARWRALAGVRVA